MPWSKRWAKTSWSPFGEGAQPHIGAIGTATPRPSLKDPKKWSATSSNLTFVGHKEDILVKKVSEKLATRLRRNVVVTAGIHWDGITSKEIKTIQNLTQKISDQILKRFLPVFPRQRQAGERKNEGC